MERKLYKNPDSYDIKNRGCDPEEIEVLCDIFERMMLENAGGALQKGSFSLKAFESAEWLNVVAFTLTLERHARSDGHEWQGIFEADGRSFEVWGTVEEVAA